MDVKIALFYLSFNLNSLTNEDIFQKIKSLIKDEIKKNVFNLIFNTKPINIKFEHRIHYPYHAAEQIEIRRRGHSMRLERFRRKNERTNEINEMHEIEERREEREQSEYEEDWEDKDEEPITHVEVKQINTGKSFKSGECVICLTNSPNVLFCNCGHLCLCVECDKIKTLIVCPVCKTENTIKRTV